jgi:hypothetical protein
MQDIGNGNVQTQDARRCERRGEKTRCCSCGAWRMGSNDMAAVIGAVYSKRM